MTHIDAQTLDALSDKQRIGRREIRHIDGCVACRRAANERGISDATIGATRAAGRSRLRGWAIGTVLAAVTAAIVAPLDAGAFGFLRIFEPRTVAAVPLTLAELRALGTLPDLSAYATTRMLLPSVAADFGDARAAATAARFALRLPAYVPPGARPVSFSVNTASAQLMTFVRRNADATGRPPAAILPADIVGSTLRIDLGATAIVTYDTATHSAEQRRIGALRQLTPEQRARFAHPSVTTDQPAQAGRSIHIFGPASARNLIPLVVVQTPVPLIASSGVSLPRLASFMLEQPGIPPRVAAAFRALGDLSTTLPIPILIDRAYTQPVAVDGVRGVGIGDNTGIGAAVVWQKNGMLYAVFATRTARDVLAIADSLR